MPLTYQQLRQAHFQITLRNWFRGLDKALFAVAAVLQFILTALVTMAIFGLAQALRALDDPGATLSLRVGIVAAWQCASFVLLRALREAAFMPRSRAFFDALPVTPRQKLRADLAIALQGYSFLWLPILWVLLVPTESAPQNLPAILLSLAALVSTSLCVNIALLRGFDREAIIALAALILYSLLQGTAAWVAPARLGCAVVAGLALRQSYLPGKTRIQARPVRSAFADGIALRSGLVVPLLSHELRSNLLIRSGVISATLIACLLVIALRTNDTSTASVVVFVAAVAAVALYRLPMLIRTTLLTKLQFLAGQPAFAQRMRIAAYGIPSLLFGIALLVAWPFDRSGTALRDATVFAVCYLAGVVGTRLKFPVIHWLMPLASAVGLIILSAML